MPSIDHSVTRETPSNNLLLASEIRCGTTERIMSTSKFLLNDPEDDDRLSNITDIVCDADDDKFR